MNKESIVSFFSCLLAKILLGTFGVLMCILGYISEFVFFAPIRYANLCYSVIFLNATVIDILRCGVLNRINFDVNLGKLYSLAQDAADKYKKHHHQRYYHPKEFLEYMKERLDNPGDPNEWEKSLNEYIASEV